MWSHRPSIQVQILLHAETNIIHIKSLAFFRKQMDIAERSNSLVVIFFYGSGYLSKECKVFLPQLEDLIKQYRCNHVDKKIIFLGSELKIVTDVYDIAKFPTVVVLQGDGKEVGRISIAETIAECIFFTGLRMLLDDCLRG